MAKRQKRKGRWSLLESIVFLATLIGISSVFTVRYSYLRKSLDDWMGKEYQTYTGYCIGTEWVGSRLSGGWYLQMDNGRNYYVASDICIAKDFNIERLNAVQDKPLTLVCLPPSEFRYNQRLVSVETDGETLLDEEIALAQLRQDLKSERGGTIACWVIIGIMGVPILAGGIIEWREYNRLSKKKKKRS